MLSILSNILEVFENIPAYILYAIETVFNLFSAALQGVFTVATELIPLPGVPAAPEFVTSINWFFPLGAVISVMTPIVVGYVSFLAIRWIYQKVGQL